MHNSNQKHPLVKLFAFLLLLFLALLSAAFTWFGIILYQKEMEMDKTAIPLEAEVLKVWSKRECSGDDCSLRRYVSYRYKHPEKGWRIKEKKAVNNILYWNQLKTGEAKFELEGGIVRIPPIINQIAEKIGIEKKLPAEEWTTRIKGENSKMIYVVTIAAFSIILLICLLVVIGQVLKFLRPEREVL